MRSTARRARSASPRTCETRARIHTLRGNLCFPLGRLDACLQAHEQAHRYALQAQSPSKSLARSAVSATPTISAAAC